MFIVYINVYLFIITKKEQIKGYFFSFQMPELCFFFFFQSKVSRFKVSYKKERLNDP